MNSERQNSTNKKCKYCNCFKALYRKSHYAYQTFGMYYCTKHERITPRDDCCEHFAKRKTDCDLSARRFDDAVADIEFMMEYLKD